MFENQQAIVLNGKVAVDQLKYFLSVWEVQAQPHSGIISSVEHPITGGEGVLSWALLTDLVAYIEHLEKLHQTLKREGDHG